ncbi:glutathione S-transferase-like [Lineus longissimus]|uniref:glutathione S-transferase-like n=1 Tax=Lineus longissimus TaxID=88925 RepID=UPI00315CEDEF
MPVLGYWDSRGLGGPIRLLLAYCKEDFEDKHFVCGDGPEFSMECWHSVKDTLGLPFPNLPYYIDGDVKITQSNAICRHIARKHDLCEFKIIEKG